MTIWMVPCGHYPNGHSLKKKKKKKHAYAVMYAAVVAVMEESVQTHALRILLPLSLPHELLQLLLLDHYRIHCHRAHYHSRHFSPTSFPLLFSVNYSVIDVKEKIALYFNSLSQTYPFNFRVFLILLLFFFQSC